LKTFILLLVKITYLLRTFHFCGAAMADQISNKHKCIFVHIPKAAGSSIEHSSIFEDQRLKMGERVGGHMSAMEYRDKYPDSFEKYFKFSLVRNPFSRLVSAYFYLCKGGGKNRYDTQVFKKYFEGEKVDFCKFCRNDLSKEMINDIIHLKPQYTFLCDNSMSIMVDFVGRQETFSADTKKIFRKLGLKYEHRHSLRSNNKHFSEYYTEDMRTKVFDLYRTDFELFHYSSQIDSYNRFSFAFDQYWSRGKVYSSKFWPKLRSKLTEVVRSIS
jgi:hypothetical protein